MPRQTPALTAAKVAALMRDGTPRKTADGGCAGLTLKVSGKSQASWVLRYTSGEGKRIDMGLGTAATSGASGGVSLAEARTLAENHRKAARAGADPLTAKQERRAEAQAAQSPAPSVPTFRQAAEAHIATNEGAWRSAKHAAQWGATLTRYVYPTMGALPVDRITTEHVLDALKPVWTTRPETATRVRQRIEAVLDASKALGHRQGENPARWKGHLAQLLPARRKVAAVEHRASLPWQQVPAFLAVLDGKAGIGAPILRFCVLTACRSREAIGATWGEFDLEAAVWTIPGDRMKAGKTHRVPLSAPVLDLLRSRRLAIQARHGAEGVARDVLVFPSRGEAGLRHPVSDMALSMLVRGMAEDHLPPGDLPRWRDPDGRSVVPHGFRTSFKGWSLAEGWQDPLSEAALAHTEPNKSRGAYARDDLLEERRPMMTAWGDFATGKARAVVVPMTAARGAA